MLAFMGRMLGQGMRLEARRLALAYNNIRLYVFSFIFFVRLAFWGKDMGDVVWFVLCCVVCLVR